MKTINDLTEGLMTQFQKLQNAKGTPEQIRAEIDRTKALAEIGTAIVGVAKVQVEFAKILPKDEKNQPQVPFLNLSQVPDSQVPSGLPEVAESTPGGGTTKK